MVLVRPEARSVVGAAAATGLSVHPMVLGVAVLIYLDWRLSGARIARWFTVSLIMLSAPGLTLAGILAANPAAADRVRFWALVTQILVITALLVVTVSATRITAPVDPLAAGLLAGLVLSALGLLLVTWAPDLASPAALTSALSFVPPLVAVVIAVIVARSPRLPRRERWRLSIGIVLLTLGGAMQWSSASSATAGGVTILASIVGAALLVSTALALVRESIRDHGHEMATLHERLVTVETAVRELRGRLHEIGTTVAGITSASRLIHALDAPLPSDRRALLEEMVEAELGRLQRLMSREPQIELEFDVDDVVRQLVVAQRAQGRSVTWEPSGCRAVGRPDDVAEAVHALLDNAAKHGGGSGTTLEVRAVGGLVEISVSDHGPGIAPDVSQHLFEWGSRSRTSSGQGIGLTIARELVERQGGYLSLQDVPQNGTPQPITRFVVGLLGGVRDGAVGQPTG